MAERSVFQRNQEPDLERMRKDAGKAYVELGKLLKSGEEEDVQKAYSALGRLLKSTKKKRTKVSHKLPKRITPEQKEAFMKACEKSPRDHCIWKTFFASAMRVGEIVGDKRTGYRGLFIEDINFQADPPEVLVHGKGDKERIVLISRGAAEEILTYFKSKDHLGPDGKLYSCEQFTATFGQKPLGKVFDIGPRMVQKLAKKYAKEAGLPEWFTPHKARHTALTEILEKTHDLIAAQEQAGHASPATTSIYLHLDTDYRKPVMKKVFGET